MTDYITSRSLQEELPLALAQEQATTSTEPPRYFALIPCAGSGQRARNSQLQEQQNISENEDDSPVDYLKYLGHLPKQYWLLNGKPMVWHTLSTLLRHPKISKTLLILAPYDPHFDAALKPYCDDLPAPSQEGHWGIHYCGGENRQASVSNGLAALAQTDINDHDWVLVHDAARPGLSDTLLNNLFIGVGDHPVGGILALPVADTLKRETQGGPNHTAVIDTTINREGLWQAQTPQMFRFGLLRRALEQAQKHQAPFTDEASALERIGYQPLLIPGSLQNMKVTYARDMAVVQALLDIGE